MGDLEIIGLPAPIELGNRVWRDRDGNGRQDPGESGFAGVTVGLYTGGGTLVASAVTDANGEYYFSSAAGTNTAQRQVRAGHRGQHSLRSPRGDGPGSIEQDELDLAPADSAANGGVTSNDADAGRARLGRGDQRGQRALSPSRPAARGTTTTAWTSGPGLSRGLRRCAGHGRGHGARATTTPHWATTAPATSSSAGCNWAPTAPDPDDGTLQNAAADADDTTNTGAADDEDGVTTLPTITTASTSVALSVNVLQHDGRGATLACWIDFNRDGDFLDAGERAWPTVASQAGQQTIKPDLHAALRRRRRA